MTESEMNKEKRDIRIVFLVFAAIFAIVAWRHRPSLISYILSGLVALILVMITFSPYTLRPVFRLWLKAAHIIGKFNTQILLAIVYVVIFMPLGLAMRLFKGDSMKRKMKAEGTYWESYELEGLKDKSRYGKQF